MSASRAGWPAPPASPRSRIDWRVVERPAFANQIGTLTLDGDHSSVRVEAVADEGGRLDTAFERALA